MTTEMTARVAGIMLGMLSCAAQAAAVVDTARTPDGGIAPQVAVGPGGTVHLIYLKPAAKDRCDIYYVRSDDGGASYSQPLRVNSQPSSAISVRHPRVAVGRGGRVHVVWNGAGGAEPRGPLNPAQPADSPYNGTPLLYARLNNGGTAFEPQRNLMRRTHTLDGGGAVAADEKGNVYAVWHAAAEGLPAGEQGRRVYIARSTDDGMTFADETMAWDSPTGACGCCHVRAHADGNGLYVLFRGAETAIDRNMFLLFSDDGGKTFRGTEVDAWRTATCPMSTPVLVRSGWEIVGGWETEGRVVFATVKGGVATVIDKAGEPGKRADRKAPAVATNTGGETIRAWTEGMGWKKGGAAAWQVYDAAGKAVGEPGRSDGVPADSTVAVFARPDGTFVVIY